MALKTERERDRLYMEKQSNCRIVSGSSIANNHANSKINSLVVFAISLNARGVYSI